MARSSLRNAGFYSQYLWEIRHQLSKKAGFSVVDAARTLSCFHLDWVNRPEPSDASLPKPLKQAIEIYRGLLYRGLPTLAPLFVERNVLKPLLEQGLVEETENRGAIGFHPPTEVSSLDDALQAALIDAHVVVDPRLKPTDMDSSLFDSDEEELFFQQLLPDAIGKGALQFCELQTPFEDLLDFEQVQDFVDQRVDFGLPLSSSKLILEIDGPQHQVSPQLEADKKRDKALTAAGWSVTRVPTNLLLNELWQAELAEIVATDPVAEAANQRMAEPLWQRDFGLAALHAVLAPFAVARIQFALLEAIDQCVLSLDSERWQITVIERDVACAAVAIADFHNQLGVLYALFGVESPIPSIDLKIAVTPEFGGTDDERESVYLTERSIQVERVDLADGLSLDRSIDLLIDISMLQRYGYNRLMADSSVKGLPVCNAAVEIRSAYMFVDVRRVSAIEPIAYAMSDQSLVPLEYVLRNVFRKASFRDGQWRILQRALSLQPVIGLLPTGGGKSLCFQLAALLQPGMTLVVDPLISLIVDQTENLADVFAIDWLASISSMQNAIDKARVSLLMEHGKLKLLFLSPERLQNQAFREQLYNLSIAYPVTYAVIDEAHCVSEWGHDFRTSYLRLADTIRKYASRPDYSPTIIALTGTASLAVLSDVQREIGVTDEDAQIYPKSFDRTELNFRVVNTSSPNKRVELYTILQLRLPTALGLSSWTELFVPRGTQTKAGILFTPHIKRDFGAKYLSSHLSNRLDTPVFYFAGRAETAIKAAAQNGFKQNQFALLAATKAFGMGIDKPNIRYTVHYNIPPSLEAFYQEAGRAGRDQQEAWCWLIFSDDMPTAADAALNPDADLSVVQQFVQNGGDGDVRRLLWLHSNSFLGLETELDRIKSVYQNFIGRALVNSTDGEPVKLNVPFDDEDQSERDRALYRLSILGIVQDYTLYRRQFFEVIAIRLADATLIENLQRYISRYKTSEAVDAVPERVAAADGNTILSRCLTVLLEFVYDEIEKKRRAALRSMVEVARRASEFDSGEEQDAYVRGELLAYLEESPFTKPLDAIAREMDPAKWISILDLEDTNGVRLMSTVDGARHLLGGCRRTLESYLDHPGLLYLSSLARHLLPDQDGSAASAEIRRSFRGLGEMAIDRQVSAVQTMVDGYSAVLGDTQEAREIQQSIASIALEELSSRALARALAPTIPVQSEQVILNHILADARLLNRRLCAM